MIAPAVLLGLVMPYLAGVQGTCDPDTVNQIKAFWNGNPPQHNLEKLNGFLTHLTAPGYYTGSQEDIECFQSNFNEDGSAFDVVITHNADTTVDVVYQATDNGDGTLTLTSPDFPSAETVYVIYFDNQVLAYFNCQDSENQTYKGFAGIGVVNANNSDIEFSPTILKGLKEADSALEQLKLATLPGIDTSCGN
uniref:Lipocalin/cytosolic fatty-acid binding domain-containing protein n=1 Tax=Homalodisca liturata TaxID=320908 RepID=A0A1B6JZP2_9HEMI